jgi:glycosyltransferase involved in cell wall biosynthesis
MKTITLMIPCYNEEEVLGLLVPRITKVADELSAYAFKFLFIDDGSKDKTMEKIKQFAHNDERVQYISLSRNYGKERAMAAGFDACETGALIIIDADLQDPPELIPQMVAYWEQGYHDVYAQRQSRKGESWFKRVSSQWYYKILAWVASVEIQRDTGDFRLLDRQAVLALRQFRETERYTKGFFSLIGFNKKAISFERDARAAGATKWNYRKLFGLAWDGITSFSTAPLQYATKLGSLIAFTGFVYLCYIVLKTIIYGSDLAGYPSLMATILFLGGIQLIGLGILGGYLAKIFHETKARPMYLIQESKLK